MSRISLQIKKTSAGMVAPYENVIFDTVSAVGGNVAHDTASGVFTLYEPGIYDASWEVATKAGVSLDGAVFVLSSSLPGRFDCGGIAHENWTDLRQRSYPGVHVPRYGPAGM